MTPDLATTYMGIPLAHPLIVGASPLVDDLDTVRRLEDSRAAAIVMHSLFEEQLSAEQLVTAAAFEDSADSFAEARSFLPDHDDFALGPDEYLDQLRKIKEAVRIPVIASLNGVTPGGWLSHARELEQAGADAIELNVYRLATDLYETGADIETRIVQMAAVVKAEVGIPVAVKLSPFHTALAHFAFRLESAGADGLVLFNRFYQPDLDIENLEVERSLHLSTPEELPLRLRWLAILSGRIRVSLAASGGVHSARDAVKAIMAGAHAVQMVSALLKHGPDYLRLVYDELSGWMGEHGYESLRQMRGNMSLAKCPDPAAYERANYVRMLQSWPAANGPG